MNIVYSLTRNLYPYLLPSIMSVLDHNPDAMIYIMAEDEQLPYELPDQCTVVKVDPFEYLDRRSPNMRNRFTYMAMIRSVTSKILPELDRCIQLDIDTIVTDSLLPLWELDLGEDLCAMCNEDLSSFRPYGEHYFNAGVMLIDLAKVRAEKKDGYMLQLLNKIRLPYIDQDAWNIIGRGRIRKMDTRFNESIATGYTEEPAVVHYAGYNRHWAGNVPRFEFYSRYKQFERH